MDTIGYNLHLGSVILTLSTWGLGIYLGIGDWGLRKWGFS